MLIGGRKQSNSKQLGFPSRTSSKTDTSETVGNRDNSGKREGIDSHVRRVFRNDGLLGDSAKNRSVQSGLSTNARALSRASSNRASSNSAKSQHLDALTLE